VIVYVCDDCFVRFKAPSNPIMLLTDGTVALTHPIGWLLWGREDGWDLVCRTCSRKRSSNPNPSEE
jgi:hypothetical protein